VARTAVHDGSPDAGVDRAFSRSAVELSNKSLARRDRGSTTVPGHEPSVSQMKANTEMTAHATASTSATPTNAIGTAHASAATPAPLARTGATLGKPGAAASAGGGHAIAASVPTATTSGSLAGSASAGVGTGAAATSVTSASAAASAHGSFVGHVTARLGPMLKSWGVALKGSLAAKSFAVGAIGLAGLVVAAHSGVAPGAQASLSLVPSWSSGPSLLGGLQAGVGGSGSAGLPLGL